RFTRRLRGADLLRVAVGQGLGVLLGPDADAAVDPLVLVLGDRVAPGELFVGGGFQEDFVELFGNHAHRRVPAGGDHLAVEFDDQRLGDRWPGNAHDLAVFDTDRI